MALRAVIGRCRSAAPLCAFLATAALSVLLAAQAQLACSRQMVMTMPGMEMSETPAAIALCPIVLILGLAAALATACAVGLLAFDPERQTTARDAARRYARLPFVAVAGSVLGLGSASVGALMAVDGNAPAAPAGWLLLAGIVVAVALASAIAGLALVRAIAALSQSLALVLADEIAVLRRGAPVPVFVQSPRTAAAAHRMTPLAARRGLRAPPLSVR